MENISKMCPQTKKMSKEKAIEILDCMIIDRIKFFDLVFEYLNEDEIKNRCEDIIALGMAVSVLKAMSKKPE